LAGDFDLIAMMELGAAAGFNPAVYHCLTGLNPYLGLAAGCRYIGQFQKLPKADGLIPYFDFGLRIVDCGIRIADCGIRILDFGLRNSEWGLIHESLLQN
jgi:hypothetical protein